MKTSPIASDKRHREQHPTYERTCPLCNSPIERVHRRFVDRLKSLISPVRRFRCRFKGWGCEWEGTL